MLKNIVKDPETGQIQVDSLKLIDEAETRTHKPGPGTYLERLLQGKTRLKKNQNYWPEEKKLEVVALYAAGITKAAELERLTKVSTHTISKWKTEDWWPVLLEQVHVGIDQEIVAQFSPVVAKAIANVEDRLLNGDTAINMKTGAVYRKPISARDATVVASTFMDKRQLLRGKATSRTEKVSTDDRLAKLAAEFERFVAAKDVSEESRQLALDKTHEG